MVVNTSGSTVTLIGQVPTKAEGSAVVGAAWMGDGVEVVLQYPNGRMAPAQGVHQARRQLPRAATAGLADRGRQVATA